VAKVYSARLASAVAVGSFTTLGTVPDGHVWVLRHMTANYNGVPASPLVGFTVGIEAQPVLWFLGPLGVQSQFTYHWSGRHVARSGEIVFIDTTDADAWEIIVSGYDLVLP
jgi:hypothetical protein